MNPNFPITPAEEAFAELRQLFTKPMGDIRVIDNKMHIGRNLSDRAATEVFLLVLMTITQTGLPLQAEVTEWKVAGVVFDQFITVEFVPKKSPLPCY